MRTLSRGIRPQKRELPKFPRALALWIIGVAFAAPNPPPPAMYQNFVVVGLLLLMIAVLPSRASEPPRGWREFYR